MDDLKHLEGKAVRSIEQDNAGLNSYIIIKFTDDSKLNISGYPHQDNGVAQLDIELEGIKLPEIKNRKIAAIEEEFDGQMDKLIIKFKQGGRMVIGAFNSKEKATAGLETTVYVENKKKFVKEELGPKPPNMYPTGRAGKYIMNSPQYEELDSDEIVEEDENENKIEEMKKFVDESIDDFENYGNESNELTPDPLLSVDITINQEEMPQSFEIDPADEFDEDDIEDEFGEDDIEDKYGDVDEEDTYGKRDDEHYPQDVPETPHGFPVPDESDNEIEITGVEYDEVESRINNLLDVPEYNRDFLEFKLKSGEQIIAKPMVKLSGGIKVLFKDKNGELVTPPTPIADIILESKKVYKWVPESLYEARRKKKFKPVDRGEMKTVKVDARTIIEVPVSMSDEEAIKKHKEKLENRAKKW